ncbi:hypothetical protein FY115_12680 [Cellvibrio japonicus]|nr:hypothetical protein FY117_12680 [Cellvibrio japonicus]QEI16566.1 hypothetical protein FY116_12685 [Cellvibrio japonicus]QEI20144.1 hypothetical protein FY115_12680 [Cellvibrio japonicus]
MENIMKKFFLLSLFLIITLVSPAKANFIAPTYSTSGTYTIDWTFNATSSCNGGSYTYPYKIQELNTSGQLLREVGLQTKPFNVQSNPTGTYTYKLWTYLCSPSGNTYYYRGEVTVQVNPKPSAPGMLTATLTAPSISLTWTKPPEPFTYYQIQRNGVSIATPSNTVTAYTDSNPVVGANTYSIRACTTTTSGCSDARTSNTITVTSQTPVGALSPELTNGVVNSAPITGKPSTFVGSVAGEFRVNESGAATYNVAINMPDGVAGVKPQVNIGYSSQADNGLLGKGWNMGGLGSISRCRQTLSQDGVARPITWTANDRYCLDGQRLMLTSGTYGQPGSVYKTEIETFVTVTAVGGTSGNPDYFIAVAKDGSKTTYGDIGTAASEVATASGVMSWNISKFEDSVGNPINYLYEGNANDGHRIKEIYYAYGTSKSLYNHNAKMVFTYEDRNDWTSGYVAGYLFTNSKRLKKITTYNGSHVFRDYTLGYDYAPAAIGAYSRVKSITECANTSGTVCYPATTFSWHENAAVNFNTALVDRNFGNNSTITNYAFLDVNGNGVLDYVWSEYSNFGITTIYYILDAANTGSASSSVKTLFNYSNSAVAPKFEVIDYNGDGHQDLMVYDPGAQQWKLYLSVPNQAGWHLQYHSILPFTGPNIVVGDINSDGLADVTELNGTGSRKLYTLEPRPGAAVTSNTYYQFGSPVDYQFTGTPASSPITSFATLSLSSKNVSFGDFNGDGKVDIALNVYHAVYSHAVGRNIIYSEFRVYVADGDNQFVYYAKPVDYAEGERVVSQVQSADINGDGLSDILYKKTANGRWYYRLSTGAGFSAEVLLSDIPAGLEGVGLQEPVFADINSDGYLDLVWRQARAGYTYNPISIKYWNPKTSAFNAWQMLETTTSNDLTYIYADANGDTWVDRITWGKKSGYSNLAVSKKSGSTSLDLIYGITDGFGNYTSVHYEPLSQSAHYLPIGDIKITGDTKQVCTPVYSYVASNTPPVTLIGESCSNVTSYNINTDDYYRQVNNPFAGLTHNNLVNAPVLETIGGMPIVTKASSSLHATSSASPGSASSKTSSISYYYKHLRMQAAGRGMLGFAELKTVDMQTGITTETKYRQDWPYIGSPAETITKTHDGKVLGHATNKWNRKTYATSTSKRYQPYVEQTVERTYALNTDGSVGTTPLQTVTTDTQMAADEYGNVSRITVTTAGGGQTLVQQTDNVYFTGAWERQMGRLERSTVTTTRNGVADTSRTVRFEYHQSAPHRGLLAKEVVAEGTADQLVTSYVYDAFGNKTEVSVTGKASSTLTQTRKTTYQYDSIGRYVNATLNNLNHTASVTARDPVTGAPTKVKDANDVTADVYYDDMGAEYLRSDASGAWSRTDIAACTTYVGVSVQCPAGAKFYRLKRVAGGGRSIDYLDGVGRVLRAATVGFDGHWVYTDSEYDILGRLKHQSTPYFESGSPLGWTTYHYDRLGRVESVKAPDGSLSSSRYHGYETTITNALLQTRTETRNGLGQLIGVRDHLGGTITYTYNSKGDLLTATTDDSPNASPNVAPVTVTLCYDTLGRKVAMHDPDKGGFKTTGTVSCNNASTTNGWWLYKYNAFGELTEQSGPVGTSSMTYDALGRMTTRKDFKAGVLDGNTAWFYDAPLGGTVSATTKGKLTAVIMNKVNATIANAQTSCGGSNHCVQTQYDSKSRPEITFTHLPDGSDYITSVKYDSIGRAYETRDVLQSVFADSGVQTQYNAYGYVYRTVDVAPRDGSRGVLSTILEMNERGQVTRETRGNGAVTVNTYNPYTGLLSKQQATVTGLRDIQHNTYDWDTVGNLRYRITAGARIGSGTSKAKEEGFCYDGLNRLVATLPSRTPACGGAPDIKYDGLGNITYKKDVGNYVYDRVNGGAHAVTSVNGVAYRYDNNGNVISGDGRSFEYTSYDMASKISKDANNYAEFSYGPDRARWQRIDKKGSTITTTTYLGNIERIATNNSTVVEWKRTVGGAVHTYRTVNNVLQANGSDKKYLYVDHLGSVDAITDGTGKVTHSMSFDAWGARRSGEDWSAQTISQVISSLSLTGFTQPITTRGYTGHEMVDDMGIIHMNGRIYDARIARFLQADPFIQAATNTQSYNRYSYVLNNPLNATDPSGYFFKKLWNKIRPFVGAIVGVVLAAYCPPCTASIWGAMGAGAAAGAAGAAANGGNILRGALTGAVSGAAFFSVGAAFQGAEGSGNFLGSGLKAADFGLKVFAHGIVGGVMSVLQGGKFGHGFASAGVTQAFAGGIDRIGGSKFSSSYFDAGNRALRITAAAIVGGTASTLSGGKFANGAMTGAFSRAFNDEALAHKIENSEDPVVDLIKKRMSGYSKKDLRKMEVGILVYRNGEGALEALTVEGRHTSVNLGPLYGMAQELGAIEYVAEFHSHPTTGGSYSMSPDDVAGAYSTAKQITRSSPNYRAFFSDPKGRIFEWDASISNTGQANRTRKEVGSLW